jgi:DNA processing protein
VIDLSESVRGGVRVPLLHASGDLSLLALPSVAIVGSRDASPAGLAVAKEFARALVNAGVVIVSGLARGIDAAAHRAAIEAGGRTIAVIGTPLERAYPAEHASLQEEICRQHLLLSPFATGTRTTRGHFPARNRVMARLASATFVAEARDGSGTMHQINECSAVGRPVFVARAIFDNTRIGWPHAFLQRHEAFVVQHANDVLARLVLGTDCRKYGGPH